MQCKQRVVFCLWMHFWGFKTYYDIFNEFIGIIHSMQTLCEGRDMKTRKIKPITTQWMDSLKSFRLRRVLASKNYALLKSSNPSIA